MLELIRSLFLHQEWADNLLLNAVESHLDSRQDLQIRGTLHHTVMVQRAFFALFLERPFDMQKELLIPESHTGLQRLFDETHTEELLFVNKLGEAELLQAIKIPWFEGLQFSLIDALLQVPMHSQNHRGQCLTRMRTLGAKPPTLDFIIWVKDHTSSTER
jgi:uncharacterized damage-inducible protein DinB